MTVSSTAARTVYDGNGSTTNFATGFEFLDNADVVVTLVSSGGVETTQVEGTNYTLSGGSGAAGTVTMTTAPASGEKLVITRETAFTQGVDLVTQGVIPAETLEQALDRLTYLAQQNERDIDRAMLFPVEEEGGPLDLPQLSDRKDKYLRFNTSTGEPEAASLPTIFDTTTVFTVQSVLDFGAKGDSTGSGDGTDDTQAFIDAINAVDLAGGGILWVPNPGAGKFYRIDTTIEPNTSISNVEIKFEEGATLDTTNMSDGDAVMDFFGAAQQTGTAIDSNLTKGDASLDATGHSIAQDDDCVIQSTLNTEGASAGEDRLGPGTPTVESLFTEWFSAATVSGSTITLKRPLRYAYATADSAKVWKITPATNIRVVNLRVRGGSPAGLRFILAKDCRVINSNNITASTITSPSVSFHMCLRCIADDCISEAPEGDWSGPTPASTRRHFNILYASEDCKIVRCKARGGTHMIDIATSNDNLPGTTDLKKSGPPRDSFMVFNDANGMSTPFTSHPGADGATWLANTADGVQIGMHHRSRRTIAVGNVITNIDGTGILCKAFARDSTIAFNRVVNGALTDSDLINLSLSELVTHADCPIQVYGNVLRRGNSGGIAKGAFQVGGPGSGAADGHLGINFYNNDIADGSADARGVFISEADGVGIWGNTFRGGNSTNPVIQISDSEDCFVGINHMFDTGSGAAVTTDSNVSRLFALDASVTQRTIGTVGAVLLNGATTVVALATKAPLTVGGDNGVAANIKWIETELTSVSGATVTANNIIPKGNKILGVVTRVTTELGNSNGTTGYKVGDGTDDDKWGDISGVTAGTTSDHLDFTADPERFSTAAHDIVITAVGGNFDGTGAIRVSVCYRDFTAPTS